MSDNKWEPSKSERLSEEWGKEIEHENNNSFDYKMFIGWGILGLIFLLMFLAVAFGLAK